MYVHIYIMYHLPGRQGRVKTLVRLARWGCARKRQQAAHVRAGRVGWGHERQGARGSGDNMVDSFKTVPLLVLFRDSPVVVVVS